ncbi:Oxysterol-binding protein-related protein 9 [Aphelenchoides fujianensis]|nr:Oxysterol-binding protein-related protein 9 [Aphelenchoides fujianensis]
MCFKRSVRKQKAIAAPPPVESAVEEGGAESEAEEAPSAVESVASAVEIGSPPVASPPRPPAMVDRSVSGADGSQETSSQSQSGRLVPTANERAQPNWGDDQEDFDRIYECTEEADLGDVKKEHGSVLSHLLKQVRPGMDLTKITLPTFILERRSLLEMYADFFAHPEDFVQVSELRDPEDRFVAVVRYYVAAFYAARKSGVAKKPYNPILGETFRCRWSVPGRRPSGQKTRAGPFPGSDLSQASSLIFLPFIYLQITFIAEQVSHHPPVSAFYAEHPASKMSLCAHIWTQSSFLGLSIGVHNVGYATLSLHQFNEHYTITFPSGYGRSILGKPWVELGGKVEIRCDDTGYTAEIDFLTKPMFGGKPHKVAGKIFKRGVKKPILTLKGEWNGVIRAKGPDGGEVEFVDVKEKPDVPKECDPIASQGERESRRLWRHVTAALYRNRIDTATAAKQFIEQRQREETKQREASGQAYQTKHFKKHPEERGVVLRRGHAPPRHPLTLRLCARMNEKNKQ